MSSSYSSGQMIPQIRVEELARRMAEDRNNLQLIDVREPEEIAIAFVEGFTNLPLSQYGEWAPKVPTQFDPHAETLVLCHHGMRSAQMCQWLMGQGFTNVKNIVGGIAAYAEIVDSSIPQY
ncbi:rhodanese-like domain-containing protein [Tumidithrix elongata RA019]|uniref:Rhodanese-like domain-containing protein n=1 Tax=Tumidithrix elongata BACA0141 TaxID=2716417 RepID=A0AAW9Q2S0_9CYAN|nr:rhodanese-like domain-containing protein [Tumidithrix elongata RA019]